MEEDNIYKKIQEAISSLPQNFSVLEEQIDIELQMEYFNYGRDLKTNFPPEMILQHKADLFDESVPVDEKKKWWRPSSVSTTIRYLSTNFY